MLWALVPVKELTRSKQRLAGLLDPSEREELVLAMLQDVLAAIRDSAVFDGVLLVSRSKKVHLKARNFVTDSFTESANADHSRAVTEANHYLIERHHAESSFAISADIPRATARDIRRVIAHHDRVTLVPNCGGEGTNAILASPPNVIVSDFGGSSLMRHVTGAEAAGMHPAIVHNNNVAMDIDEPRDLERALVDMPPSFTRQFLNDSGISRRLSIRDETGSSQAARKTFAVDPLA